jgi:hypothetical protein
MVCVCVCVFCVCACVRVCVCVCVCVYARARAYFSLFDFRGEHNVGDIERGTSCTSDYEGTDVLVPAACIMLAILNVGTARSGCPSPSFE